MKLILIIIAILLNFIKQINCLYFKLESDSEKCFVDELEKGAVYTNC